MTKWKTISAIAGIVILEAIALFKGINGTQFTLVMVIIAGLGGYTLAKGTLEVGL